MHTERHAKAQGCLWGLWVHYGTLKNSILHHKLAKGWFGLLSIVCQHSFIDLEFLRSFGFNKLTFGLIGQRKYGNYTKIVLLSFDCLVKMSISTYLTVLNVLM